MGKQVKWTPPDDAIVADAPEPVVEDKKPAWTPPDDAIPVKKKDQSEQSQETSSSDSQELGTPSGKNTTSIQLSEEQKRLIAQKPKDQQQLQQEKNSKDFQDTRIKDSFGIAENKSKDPITAFTQTVTSGLSDQLPKEYYTQRLRMSKGSFGDLYDSRSDLNAFGGDKFSENLPKGTSIDAFKEWNNKQSFKVKQQSYDDRAKLFLTEKLGPKGFEDLKSKFKVANVEQRVGFEKHIQEQNVEAGQKLGGVVQDLRDVHGANDFLSFAGNMIGQVLYRAPTSLAAGPVGSIVSESAAVYDRQLDLIAEKEGISREEVIKKDLDKPAEGQALAVLAGTLDSASEFNIVGMFKKAAGKQLTENVVKQFAKGFVRGAAPEVATEVAQGELEEIAASKGAGVEYHPDGWRMATSAVGALIGGGILGGGANIHLSPELKAMSTEDVVKNTTTNQSSDNIPSIEKAADVIDAKVQGTSEATVAQEKLNPPKDDIPASPVTMTDQLPTTSNAIQTKELTNIQQNDIFVNEKKEPNLLPKGKQEESGVNRKTETDINSEVQNRPIEAAYAWLQAFAGNNSEKIKNIEASMSGQSKNSSEQQASEILGGLNDARSEIRAQIDNGGKNRKTSTEIGARSSQRQEQSEQRSGQSDASKSSGTHDISQGEQGSHGNDDSIDKDSIRKMVSSLFQLREVPKNNESVRIARDLQKMLSTGTQEQKEFIVSLIKENIYAISKSSSAKILSSEPQGTGSQGSERGGMERGQQGESPAGEGASQEETVSPDQKNIQGDNSQEQQSEVKKYEVKPVILEKKGNHFDYNPSKNLSAHESEIETKFADDLDEHYKKYKKEYEEKYGNVLDADNIKMFSKDFVSNPSKYSNAVHSPSSSFLFKIYQEKLADKAPSGKKNKVVFIAGGAGSGKSSTASSFDDVGSAQIVYNTSMAPLQVSKNQINRALNAGKDVDINYVYRDPIESFEKGVIPRAIETGRVVPIAEIVRSHIGSRDTIEKIKDEYVDDRRVKIKVFDNTKGAGEHFESSFDKLPQNADNSILSEKLNTITDKLYNDGKINKSIYDQLKGNNDSGGKGGDSNTVKPSPPLGGAQKKSLLNRAHEGVTDEQVKSSIEKHGLTYEVESHASAEKSAADFISEVGVDKALDAVRKSEVDDGAAAFVWAKAIDEVGKKLSASKDKTEIKELTDLQTKIIDEFDKKARSGGRFISALQEVYKSSDFAYKLDYQIKKYKEANNGKIPKEVEDKFTELDTKLKEANQKIAALEGENKKSSSASSVKSIHQDFQVQKERRVKIAKARKEKIDSFFDSLKVKNDPNKLNSITQVIGEVVWNGSIEVMRKAVMAGNDVATAIQAGVDYINEHYRGNDFNEDEFRKTVQPGIEKAIANEESDIRKPEMKNGKLSIPKSLIRDLIESGASTIEELTDQVHALIKNDLPDISIREVRDAITKYGETRTLSKEELDVKVRELKRVGILISQLEDVQNKLRPLRSGVQRDKLTDQERRMQREIKEAMKDLPVDEEAADQEWRNALDSVKSRLKNQITDLEEQIKTGEKTPKKTGIKYDQEANDLKEQRDKLKEIIEQLNGKSGYSDEQKVRSAINSLEKTIAEYERRVKEKDFDPKAKSYTPETPELKAIRQKRDQIKEVYKKLEQDLGVVDKKKLETVKKNLKKGIERYETRIKNKDFVSVKKKPAPLDKEATDLRIEREKIKQQFDVEQEKNRLANRSLSEESWDTFVDVVNLPKSILASIDMSAPFRQGALLSVSHPKAGAASFSQMFQQAFSEKKADEWLLKLKDTPQYDLIKRSKLYIAEPTTRLTAKEDQFISNIASKIPIFKVLYKASERAYTGYLNKLRVDVFSNGADQLMESGITPESNPEAYRAWADFINNATGRGNLGAMEEAATVLNGFFFSPRFVASRVNLLNPVKYAKMPPEVRKMAMKSVLAYVGFSALALTIAGAAGAEVEKDPRSSDFAKIKIGNTRYDILAGEQQVIRLIAQLMSGHRKVNGKIINMDGKKFPFENRGDVALRFVRSKLSPSAGSAVNLLTGKDIVGNDVTIQGELIKNAIPLYIQDISSMYQTEGPTGLLTSMVPAFFGVGVQNYSKKKKHKEEPSPWF